MTGAEARERLRRTAAEGRLIVGAGAGTGLSAKCAEAGGADLIVIYNSGRYRMAGRGSLAGMLPYGDANAIVLDMAREVLPVVESTPVLAGVCGTDPFRQMPVFLDELIRLGFAGVQNFPTVGLIDGTFRQGLEETGMGFDLEVEMIAEAARLGLLTTAYVFTPDEGGAMAEAGADVVVAHMGLTTKGAIGARTALSLDACVDRIGEIGDAIRSGGRETLLFCHGGPIAEPEDVRYVIDHAPGIVGFFGASSIERLPTEIAITDTVRQFKALSLRAGSPVA
jgi:predicted TIM-barrel enzyme